jgi:hypothetical protein
MYETDSGGARLAAIAAKQFGVVSTAQVHASGFTPNQITTLVRNGHLHRLHRGVYAVGHRNVALRGRLLAAVMACGEGAFLSHRTAGAERGLCRFNLNRIEVTVPAGRTPKHQGLVVHRTIDPIDRLEVTKRGGLLVATVPRVLLEVAEDETPRGLENLITAAVHRGIFRPEDIEAVIRRHGSRHGVAMLRGAVERYRPGMSFKSGLELSFDRWHARHPDIPDPQRNIHLGIWEIDRAWPEQRLALELDGRNYHTAVKDFDKDRLKDTELQLMGWRPMRVSDFMWEWDRARMVRNLYGMLGITPAQ